MIARQIAGIVVLALIIIASIALGILGDWLWFLSIGYESVFLTVLLTSVAIGALSFIAFFLFSFLNILVARKAALGKKKHDKVKTRFLAVLAGIISLGAAVAMASRWEIILKYLNYTSFGVKDAVFGLDVGFYVFTLPFYSFLINFCLALFIVSGLLALVSYLVHSNLFKVEATETESFEGPFGGHRKSMSFKWRGGSWHKFVVQASTLLFLVFLATAANLWISQYSLLYLSGGTVFGPGFTDVNVTMPLLVILSVIAVVIGLMFLANIRVKKPELIKFGVAAFIIISVIGLIAAGVVQGLIVGPDEFNAEKPYLERNIQATMAAYGLGEVQEEIFPLTYTLSAQDIANNGATVNNIRLWDWRPLQQTYDQLQLFRTYYDFNDVDVDRYELDGMYKEVLVSAREMNTRELSSQAQTWVNTHLVYTHGYGAVMNPVDRVTNEGLPEFYLKDIPPASQYLELEQPRIYFGESTDNYAIVKTSTEEFDYPSGDENIYTSYGGTAGVPLADTLSRLVYAVKFVSIELLVSGSLTPESRLLMNRNINERVPEVAPFLTYDYDPYVVVSDGRLYWIMDAYTTTDLYPYSEPLWVGEMGLNYIRNSVKAVVDAYNGDISYYVVDPSDPIIQTYQKIFPGMFLDFQEMPDDLKKHVRYPEGLFRIQAEIYSTYHMRDPMVFYNKEDVWVTPNEIYRGGKEMMQPYYVIMKLPGEEKEEFIMMIPFNPRGKENMIGWMAARSDVPNYGKTLVYQFSKQELTYGPMQIEARIDQDTEISQLITLWSQSGSRVVRGNTLVIPIEGSIMYVEPLYLEATESGTLPQLQRVIVAYGDKLTMQKTLSQALDVIFGTGAAPSVPGEPPAQPAIPEGDREKLARIAELYDLAQEALNQGDLGLYQSYFEQIGGLI